jgi:hypothetical protein
MLNEYKQDSLRDLIKKFRQSGSNSTGLINKALSDIKKELFASDKNVKVHALQKLIVLYLYNYDIKWASFNTMEILSTCGAPGKRYGYFIGQMQIKNNTDFLQLIPNQIRIDLKSQNFNYINSALNFVNGVMNPQLANEITKDLEMLLNVNNNHLRKKLIVSLSLCAEKFLISGSSRFWEDLVIKFVTILSQKDVANGVAIVIISCIQKICRNYPDKCITVLISLMNYFTKCEINWNLIKVIDIFAMLFQYENKFTKKKEFIKIIADQLGKTKSKSVEAQLVQLVITNFDVKTNPSVGELIENCEERLKKLLFSQDNNLLIKSLRILKELFKHNRLVAANYLNEILKILDMNSNVNNNKNIQIECLEIINLSVSKENYRKISDYLFDLIPKLGTKAILTILEICTYDSYSRLDSKDNFFWFLEILFKIAENQFEKEAELRVSYIIRDICQRIEILRETTSEKSFTLLQSLVNKIQEKYTDEESQKKKISFLEINNELFTEEVTKKHADTLITVICFVIGEYTPVDENSLIPKHDFMMKALLGLKAVKEYYFIPFANCLIKLFMKLLSTGRQIDESICEALDKFIDYQSNFLDLENLEMNIIMKNMIKLIKDKPNDLKSISSTFFNFKMTPLSDKAQAMVIPSRDLDLNVCFQINDDELNVTPIGKKGNLNSTEISTGDLNSTSTVYNLSQGMDDSDNLIFVDKNLYTPGK